MTANKKYPKEWDKETIQEILSRGVGAEDLIRLKLERFEKHDPEDIYAIIRKEKFPYERFSALVKEGKMDYIGRIEEYLVSAQLVVERMYPENFENFSRQFGLT